MNEAESKIYDFLETFDLNPKINSDSYKKSNFDLFFNNLQEKKLKKGEHFTKQGQTEKHLGILVKGVIRTYYLTKSGDEFIKSFGLPVSFIGGYASLITGRESLINVQALTDCTVMAANYSEIVKLFDQSQIIERIARKVVESFFVEKEIREFELLSLPAEERYLKFQKQYATLETIIPQYHIASYLGVSPTQLSRIRKKLSSR